MKLQSKIVECSLGIKTTEDMARKIDSLLPNVPNELRKIVKKSGVDTAIAPELRTDISTITTGTMDRDNEIVLPEGINLDEYRANPIVLYEHTYSLPCGKCLWIKPTPMGLSAKTQYPARPESFVGDWLPDFVYEMIKAEVLKGKSIGFLPLEYRDATDEERQAYPNVDKVITNSLLVEYSCVSVPSNPKALVEAINKGVTKLCSGLECMSKYKIEVVGKVKQKKSPVRTSDLNDLLDFNVDDIANEVIANILNRWEA